MPPANELAVAVGKSASQELNKALDRIKHCVDQLSEEQVWSRPTESMNSIGNLILHLCGNLRQWIVAGLGGAKDTRDRPKEFAERGPIPKQELLQKLKSTTEEAGAILTRLTDEQLLRVRRIQEFDVNGLDALFNSVPHFRGHTQEIIHMTRSMLGDGYKYAWKPRSQTAELASRAP